MRKFIVLFLFLGLVACSSTSDRKAVYEKKAEHDMALEVPPDLTTPNGNTALDIPAIASGRTTFSSFSGKQQQTTGQVLASVSGDSRIVRDGSMQWLEIKASADNLWPQLIAFLRNEGFDIKVSDTRLGIIETGWQESRIGVQAGWISSLLNKLYDSGLRDKYRVRVEKAEEGITRIFVAHRGLEEKGTDDTGGDIVETYWQVRDPDPELEAEMMQRFLVFRGVDAKEARKMVAKKSTLDRAILKEEAGLIYLEVSENFPRS
jgi:outer membrane protein assembly factor BamC